MKKQKLKNFLKYGILIFGLAILLTNCQKDSLNNTPNDDFSNISIKITDFNEIISNKNVSKKLKNFSYKSKSSSNSFKDILYNVEHGFSIDTDIVKHVVNGDYHSYNFIITRDNPIDSKLENLVLSLNNEGSYNAYIVKYDFTSQEFENIKLDSLTNRTTLYTPIDFDSSFLQNKSSKSKRALEYECNETWEWVMIDGGDEGELVGAGNEEAPTFGWALVSLDCGFSNGGGDDGNGNYDSEGGTTSGGGEAGDPSNNDPEQLVTAPTNDCGHCNEDVDDEVNEIESAVTNINMCVDDLSADQLSFLNTSSSTIQLANYLETHGCSNETINFAKSAIEILIELPDAKFERIKELSDILKISPWALIQDCAEQNGLDITNYQQLYDHTLPTQCLNRLNILGGDFQDQPLAEGNAAVANVDYYGVEITTSPDINEDGNPDTDAEVFQAYKKNFSSLASGGKDDFEFSCNNPFGDNFGDVSWTFLPYFANDVSIWNSSNPLTAIFKIDASAEEIPFGDFISDDGAIMISKFTFNYWIGSTIATEFSGTQPFSGNRQWGFITNLNGNLELYARAVDVARVSNLVKNWTPGSDECKEDSYYNIGEATWSNLQEEIKQFIIDNGGQAQVVPKTAVRFDKNKIKELLESNESIDQIPCD